MEPTGTIVFKSIGRLTYGFDIYAVNLPSCTVEDRLTDGICINYNGQFVDENKTIAYISERTGSHQIFLNHHQLIHSLPHHQSLFHDRPIIRNDRLYFISAHQQPDKPFRSWTALYSTSSIISAKCKDLPLRLTPYGSADYSPALSQSGNLIAVASYVSGDWPGELEDLKTDIVVFRDSDPLKRVVVCQHGGWPTWQGDSTVFFHRQADDGWWSIFRVDLPNNIFDDGVSLVAAPIRVTPPGVHCFTPAAMHHGRKIAVATRRKGSNKYRHIEIFDVESKIFYPVTQPINPNIHHYNPFVSLGSTFLGYHRFRGEGATGDSVTPHLEPVISPIPGLRMFRLNGAFPTISPGGDFIAHNHDFFKDVDNGLKVIKSDGTKRWTLFNNRTAFSNAWNPVDKNVIFTSIGPPFHSAATTVQIARVTFNLESLTTRNDGDKIPVDIKILTKEETGNNAFPACSPDGKYIVFRSGRNGHKNLYIIDAFNGEFGGEIRQLTNGPWIDTMPNWSPDGKLIAFSSNRHVIQDTVGGSFGSFGVYLIRPDGSDVRRIEVAGTEVAGIEVERELCNHVYFSADGEWLLFTSNLGGLTADPVSLPNHWQPYGDLYVMRLDGTRLQRLTWNPYENGVPTWCPQMLSIAADELGSGSGDKLGDFDELWWIKCDF